MIPGEPSAIPITEAEQQCIRIAQEIRLNSLKAELKVFSTWRPENTWSLDGILPDIDWPPGVWGKARQVILLPIGILLLLFCLLLIAYIYLGDTWERSKKRRILVKEVREIERSHDTKFEVPEEKTIWSLWRLYSLEERFGREKQLHILSAWVENLYGPATRERFDFTQMILEIRIKHFEANTPYYNREPDAPYFFFNNPASSLAIKISGELPPYMET